MRICWQLLWPGELPLRDVDWQSRVWVPRKNWVPIEPGKRHAVIPLSSVHVREARQWIRSRVKKLDTVPGIVLVYVRDPRIMKGGNFIRKKVDGHYVTTTSPFEVVGYDDYVEIGMLFYPQDAPQDIYDPDEKSPHPDLQLDEV
jgi:hypothetical protein